MKKLKIIILLMSLALIISQSIVMAEDIAQEATVENQKIESNKCKLYIIYPKQLFKSACPVFINGILETCLQHTTYTICDTTPGKTKIAQLGQTYSELILDTEPGKDYYVKIKLRMPMKFPDAPLVYVDFIPIDEIEGQKLLTECSVVDWSNKK